MKHHNDSIRIEDLKLIGKGREAEIYVLRPGSVVKLYYHKGKAQVDKEYLIQQNLMNLGLPVAQSNGVMSLEKRNGLVMEHISGTSMLYELVHKPWKIFSLAKSLAKLHSQILSKNRIGIPSGHERLMKRIEKIKDIDENIIKKAIQQFSVLDDRDNICHGDFHPDNVLIGENDCVIIDWSNIYLGNPLSDVARTSLILTLGDPPPGTSKMMKWLIGYGRRAFHSNYLKHFFKLNPDYSRKELKNWILPMALDRLSEGIAAERSSLLKIIKTYSPK